MIENFDILKKNLLFKNCNEDEINSILSLGNKFTKQYHKDEIILNEGYTTEYIYFILNGEVTIYQNDIDGNTFLKSKLLVGSSFAHIFAITKKVSNCVVTSESDTTLLCINIDNIINSNDITAQKFKDNLLLFLSHTTYKTSSHLSTLSLKTLRKKIFSYLMNFNYKDQKYFEVPLNREQMSQYLGVNRTSLSKELIALKNEGILDYKRNRFIILDIEYFESHI